MKNCLNKVCDCVEMIEKFQNMWMYIVPICESNVCGKIPQMKEEYHCAMKMWKEIMNMVELSSNAEICCTSENLCNKVEACCQKVDEIQKKLECYLA